MKHTSVTLHGTPCLVVGFGRIGKVLAHDLHALGAKVSVSARKRSDLAWIDAFGYAPLHTNRLSGTLGEFRVVFNTVPHQVLDETLLSELPRDCLLIELAGASGFDMDAVERLRLSYLRAPGLRARCAGDSGACHSKNADATHGGGYMKIGFAFCGSFCNHPGLLKIYEDIAREHEIVPILSENAAKYSTRFGTAEDFVTRVEAVAGRRAVRNIVEAEPLGPQGAMEALVIAPCTGQYACKTCQRYHGRAGNDGGEGAPAKRQTRRARAGDERWTFRERREHCHAPEPKKLLFCPLRAG